MHFPEPVQIEDWNKLNKNKLKNRNWVFDLEGDGLLGSVSKLWVLVAIDPDTLDTFVFSDYDDRFPDFLEFTKLFDSAKRISGHHICGYDLPAMKKVLGWSRRKETKPVDTLILSKKLDYLRFGSGFRHSLQIWGEFFGYPKVEHEEWDKYSDEMFNRCLTDTRLNVMVFKHLTREMSGYKNLDLLRKGLDGEHAASEFMANAQLEGWTMDRPLMEKVLKELEKELKEIESKVNPQLRMSVKLTDNEPKKPVFIKTGNFNAHTARWFQVDPSNGSSRQPVVKGEFTRIEFIQPEIGNQESVKSFLKGKGWEPDEWNYKKVGRKFIKVSEKLTSSSLEKVEYWGPMVDRYFTIRARHSILVGWLREMGDGVKLHGDAFVQGTPTWRMAHKIIANIPSPEAVYGTEFRKMFTVPKGWSQVGADSAGCQVRALCHYLKNDDYTDTVINGDVHQLHTDIALAVTDLATRGKMKRVFFAMIFGAGGGKLGLYLSGVSDVALGAAVKSRLIKRIGGFEELVNKIERIYSRNYDKKRKQSWLPCIDGSRVWLESPHKGLNYVLQSCEAVTIKCAVDLACKRLDDELGESNWKPLIVYHDEIQIAVKEGLEEKACEILEWALKAGPESMGISIMEGNADVGKNWFDCH